MISTINKRYFLLAVDGAKVGKSNSVDIAVRCPVCGDSRKNKNSTRLHLYHKNGKDGIQCFNGDCQLNGRVYNLFGFLKSFYPNLLENYKRENFVQNLSHLSGNSESADVFANISNKKESTIQESDDDFGSVDSWFPEDIDYKVEHISEQQKPVLAHNLFDYFENILEHDEAITYLAKRGFDYFNSNFEWYFGIQDLQIGDKLYKLTNALIIPLYYGDEMYGFYSRNIYSKDFFTYMPEQNIGYKIFNFFKINKEKECYIFEGIFDALSMKEDNVIALMGAKIPEERLKELKNPIFVLDNDKTGILNSIEYAKKGYKVYIQPDIYKEKDMNELMLNHQELDVSKMIKENLYTGISAEIRLKSKL
jgi:hypothetical protein